MHRILPAALAALAVAVLAACSAADSAPESSAPNAAVTRAATVLSSCGVEAEFTPPAESVVTIKSSAAEMVIGLGAGDRLVGAAALDGPLPTHVTGVPDGVWAAEPSVLAEKVPSFEAVLEVAPDAVLAGWESNLSADGAGERARYHELGVETWVSPSACRDPALQIDHLTFDDVFAEITAVGAILGREDAAAAVVEAQRAALEASPADARALTALWYSSGSDTPFVGGGAGAPQLLMESAGLENVAADIADTWASLSWEEVAERNPDVIVLVDAAWNTAEHKREVLASNPVTAALDAVAAERYLVVPFAATEAGIRTVDGVLALRDQLEALH